MNKKELCNALAEKTGLTKTEAQKAFNAVIEIVTDEMKRNGRITLIGFGSFSVKQKAARKGMNPTSFAPIDIPAKKGRKFQTKYLPQSSTEYEKKRKKEKRRE